MILDLHGGIMNISKFLSLPCLLGMLFVSTNAIGSTRAEQEQALSKIFSGLEYRSSGSKSAHYGAKFTKLVQDKLGDISELKGYECRLKVSLSDTGNVEHVSMSNQNALCRKGFNAVWEVGNFPMPDKKEDAKKLKDINLMLIP
jgi:membrane protein involved in colicin uptake